MSTTGRQIAKLVVAGLLILGAVYLLLASTAFGWT
jgi:hypothetical protein